MYSNLQISEMSIAAFFTPSPLWVASDRERQELSTVVLGFQEVELGQEGKDHFQADKLQSPRVVEYRFRN